ncbi:atrial natriuretic peptide-converting enzyme [Tribolium castaneum]|nr:PREDICTED: atrial natriuretic peptide-converting enzyme [Tribolium castaneum]|eukprot:XP_972040.2 PREDICTED: atrial natriuretic peptide-converting enzyme [Tribolium castaneum]
MTVTMEKRNHHHRKSSWDSKMSVSTISTGPRHFRRSPSSILSSDSDIRFTRKKLTSQYRCGCCILATFLLLLLIAAAAVYIGYTYFMPEAAPEQVFRGTFRVIKGDFFTPDLTDTNTTKFKNRSRSYTERLNLLFRRSPVGHGFMGTEVLALDGTEGKDLIVHFNVHIDPTYTIVQARDVEKILAKEITLDESLFFQNLTIDASSLEVKSVDLLLDSTTTSSPSTEPQRVTQTPAPPRKCFPLQLKYCTKLPYNVTTYPNLMGHRNVIEVKDNVITFRELVDAECYRHAYDFICQILQPSCVSGEGQDEMILPCRSFCREFMAGCGARLSEKMKESLDCSQFPEYSCAAKPGCVEELQARALSPRVCDGVIDCQDLSDERSCTYCPKDYIHCGSGRSCIRESQRCDGRQDCPDGSDERACLSLTPSIETVRKVEIVTPHLTRYHSEGFVAFNEKGEIGKLCTENLNHSLPVNKTTEVLHTVASSLCKTLSYQNILSVQVEKDLESNISYVSMKDPLAPEISFVRSPCFSKQVLKVACSNLECGIQSAFGTLPKMAAHGDWPWHVALFKEDVHICDGTLISADWVITTTSCFQGQPKAEWTARFGSVRLLSTSPWEQERRIVGMVKSPVEGSTVAMVKLDQNVIYNDFVRPICLPDDSLVLQPEANLDCNTLGWARNREQLQRVQVKVTPMEKCENVSISTVNSLCTETFYGKDDCNEEEFAGSPMVCHNSNTKTWTLVGVTNWRIACSSNSVQRPRMYDKITSNINWIRETMKAAKT